VRLRLLLVMVEALRRGQVRDATIHHGRLDPDVLDLHGVDFQGILGQHHEVREFAGLQGSTSIATRKGSEGSLYSTCRTGESLGAALWECATRLPEPVTTSATAFPAAQPGLSIIS